MGLGSCYLPPAPEPEQAIDTLLGRARPVLAFGTNQVAPVEHGVNTCHGDPHDLGDLGHGHVPDRVPGPSGAVAENTIDDRCQIAFVDCPEPGTKLVGVEHALFPELGTGSRGQVEKGVDLPELNQPVTLHHRASPGVDPCTPPGPKARAT